MTVAEIIDGIKIPENYKGMVKNTMRIFAPGILESQISVAVDREAERVVLRLGNDIVMDKSFAELESYAQPAEPS